MPLVTQLREGVHPLVFPTDLTVEKSSGGGGGGSSSCSSSAAGGNGLNSNKDVCKTERKSPLKRSGSPAPNNDLSGDHLQGVSSSTPLNCSSASEKDKNTSGGGKLKHFTQEEATVLMLKAAAEKTAHAANNSGNLSDNSYSDEPGNISGGGGGGGGTNSSEYHSAFGDVGATGLSINILNSISAMNSLISGSGNGGLGLAGAAALGVGGVGSGAGHPCPECGRLYKLKSSLRNHQKWECGKEPQFQCPFCVYRAKQKMHIGRHMERMHKEKFFKVEDLKCFTTPTMGGGGGSGVGAGAGGNAGLGSGGTTAGGDASGLNISSGGEETSSSTIVADIRQHFS